MPDTRDELDRLEREGRLDPARRASIERMLAEANALGRRPADLERALSDLGLIAPVIAATSPEESMLPPSAPWSPRPERRRYEERDVLGRGGMGEVRLAFDVDLRREVAIKTMRAGSEARRCARFVEEAQVTGQLQHPNIVPVHELGAEPETQAPFLVMKRVRGRSLREVVEGVRAGQPTGLGPAGPEKPEEALARLLGAFLKVCDAVAYAHSRGVIHRDLKPDNVMTGEFGEVLVMDWGLAKVLGRATDEEAVATDRSDSSLDQDRTQAGQAAGTPAYMSPEQAEGRIEDLDERSDVYSLGAVLYHLIALVRPIDAPSTALALLAASEGAIASPTSRSKAPWPIPRELEAVVKKAMARAKEDRYPDVASLQADVDAFLGGRRLQAARYSPWQLAAKWARRNRALLAGTAAVLVALCVGLAGMLVVRREDAQRALAARVDAAEARYSTGTRALERAGKAPFNPAAPQDWFQEHVAALLEMGAGLEEHPSPPDAWRDEVARSAGRVQERAESVGDWALARILARSAEVWGAVDAAEADRRVERIERERRERADRDRARLEEILDRIAAAEALGGKQGRLVPGEVPERARSLAAVTGPEVTRRSIELLADPSTPPGVAREFLLALLGAKADLLTAHDGRTSADLIRDALGPGAGSTPSHELAAWISTAARLEAIAPGTFPDLAARLDALAGDRPASNPVVLAIARARESIERLSKRSPLPSPQSDPEGFRRRLVELADWAAAAADSGADYTGFLIETASRRLSTRQLGFVYDQLGLSGDALPPDPARPDQGPLEILRRALRALPPEWIPSQPPAGADVARWESVRVLAVRAAVNLARLGDPELARELFALRAAAGRASSLHQDTRIAFALLPLSGWHEPRTAQEFYERALARREVNDLTGAIEDFDRALRLDPRHADAMRQRGNARGELGDLAGALADLDAAVELAPEDPKPFHDRGRLRWTGGDLDSAIEDLDRAIEIDPSIGGLFTTRGLVRAGRADTSGALADLERAIELDPRTSMPRTHLASILEGLGRLEEALAGSAEAVRLDPDDTLARSVRARLRKAAGDLEGAIRDLDRAIESDPHEADLFFDRAGLLHESGDHDGALDDLGEAIRRDPDRVGPYLTRADLLLHFGRTDEAATDLDAALALDPENAAAHFLVARLHFLAGRSGESLAALERVLAIDPRHGPALYQRAQARAARADAIGSLSDLDRCLGVVPDHADALALRGQVRARVGRIAEGIADLARAVELRPENAPYRYDLGVTRLAAGDEAGALAEFTRATELDPALGDAWFNRATLLQNAGRHAEAFAAYERAIEARPDFGEAYLRRAWLRRAQGDLAGAIQDFTRALELEPPDADTFFERGALRHTTADPAGARSDYDRAIELAPDHGEARHNRAVLRFETGDVPGALADLDRALAAAPRTARYWRTRAAIQANTGDLAAALESIERALEFATPAERPDLEDIRRRIQGK